MGLGRRVGEEHSAIEDGKVGAWRLWTGKKVREKGRREVKRQHFFSGVGVTGEKRRLYVLPSFESLFTYRLDTNRYENLGIDTLVFFFSYTLLFVGTWGNI